MHPQPRRRPSTSIANRARKSFRSRPGVEPLEGRALLTVTVTPIDFPATVTSAPVAMNGVLYFSASDAAHGDELWRSDGTAAGTYLLKDIRPGTAKSSPRNLTVVGNTLFFSANDGPHGFELWKTDGTAAGTVMVKDAYPGAPGLVPAEPAATSTARSSTRRSTLSGGYELFKSDGTAAGTGMVKDINPGSTGSYPANLTAVGGTCFFTANDGAHGMELWKSDGTAAGTVAGQGHQPRLRRAPRRRS